MGMMELATLEHSRLRLYAHPPEKCEGRSCTLHNRTDHHMRDLRQHWVEPGKFIQRICPHDIGHPDPDEQWSRHPHHSHPCDGCCNPPASLPMTTLEVCERVSEALGCFVEFSQTEDEHILLHPQLYFVGTDQFEGLNEGFYPCSWLEENGYDIDH